MAKTLAEKSYLLHRNFIVLVNEMQALLGHRVSHQERCCGLCFSRNPELIKGMQSMR
jgi:hypothetical protein